ncbi:MAG: D-alanyl-D-alanine carboxypeptidase family protein [Lachnospiraceae bacterium]
MRLPLEELLHVLLIYSGNDAAMAIARQVGGTVDQFVEMMNQEALELGATNTHFANPSGLQDENHYTTVYDIYLMLQEAMTLSTISRRSCTA